jgi:hypothetical protein
VWGFEPNPTYIRFVNNYSWYEPAFHNYLLSISYLTEIVLMTGSHLDTSHATYVQYASGYEASGIKDGEWEKSTLNIMPNPTKGCFTIEFLNEQGIETTIQLMDIFGHQIATLGRQIYPIGKNQCSFDATSLPRGIYLISLVNGAQRLIRKIDLL